MVAAKTRLSRRRWQTDLMPPDSGPVTQVALIPLSRFSLARSGQDVFGAQIPT